MPRDVYDAEHYKVIESLLRHAQFLVAELEDAPGEALGWICFEPHVLHYVYVKQMYRREWVATHLAARTPPGIRHCSHFTRVSTHVSFLSRLTYNPYLAFRYLGERSHDATPT